MSPPVPLRVLVAGAGAVGSTTALALARAGARVTLADPAALGDNASGIAAGMLAPAFEAVFDENARSHLHLMRHARGLWPDMAASIGLPLDRAGAMAVGPPGELDAWRRTAVGLGVDCQALSCDQARARAPWLSAGLGGLWTSEDWRLEPKSALEALAAAARAGGVEVIAAAVTDFELRRAWLVGGRRLDVDALVIVTGASRSLSAIAPELQALIPIKGHILRARGRCLSGPVARLQGAYICPSPSGAVIGSTMEIGKADTAVDPDAVDHLARLAAHAAPSLAGARVTARAGVRAATQDGLPLVGRSGTPGVWLAVGARRNGWLLAPLIAEAIVAGLMGSDQGVDLVARYFTSWNVQPA